ncbi:MAG: type III PLP-dependent enzyme [Haloechinothrix sp.]
MSTAATATEREHPGSATLDRIRAFLAQARPQAPCLVMDLDTVAASYATLTEAFAPARVSYAVKANPSPAIVRALALRGAGFDVASLGEVELCRAQGAAPESLSFGNTIKKPADIAAAYAYGVREFFFDAPGDLRNIAEYAPGARVFCRLFVTAPACATPFGRKFGCAESEAAQLLVGAHRLGLEPAGIGFHVGSQQLDVHAWDSGIAAAARVFGACAERGIRLKTLNLGGGFAACYTDPAPAAVEYAESIDSALRRHFPGHPPELVLEPGRAVVAEAGVIRSQVILIARRSPVETHRWVYLDVGRYNGLAETENEAIAYRFRPVASAAGAESGPVILAGPTCDGDDVLYQRTPYQLPLSLAAGDELDILSAGAYTASYSSVAFNGLPPLHTYCLSEGKLLDDR